ncbi:MAG: threonine dehydratase [Ilumatobacter sp.]|uniref:threonine dehydratase n=1 Tax=Ilumatobacter sp. TaxID=1967498 RepID=UPI003C71AF69
MAEPTTAPLPTPLSLTRAELDAATLTVRHHVPPTPQYEWPLLTEHAGSRVTVKHENHTPVGAFKVRGGLVFFDRLARERPEVAGVVSATRGNHGQSLAFAGRAYGRDVTIFVPHGNSVEKNAAMRALGATVIEHGDDFQEAREASVAHAAEHALEAVPPFQRDLVLGVATYALELFEGAGPIDTIYVPIGMGSGINAIIAVRDVLGLDTQVVGVVSDAAPASKLTFDSGTLTNTDAAATFVDGVATRAPDPQSMAGVLAGAARVLSVSDDAVADAMRTIYRTTHNVAESAGAIALAGLLSESPSERGEHSAFVLCGGNVDTDQFAAVLSGTTPTV